MQIKKETEKTNRIFKTIEKQLQYKIETSRYQSRKIRFCRLIRLMSNRTKFIRKVIIYKMIKMSDPAYSTVSKCSKLLKMSKL